MEQKIAKLEAKINSLELELKVYKDEESLTKERLKEFDLLDFDYYTNQRWDKLSDSHTEDITCYYPDGSKTVGLYPEHIDELKPLFVFAPDTRIEKHPVSFGKRDWTAVIGEIEGTFSEPMPIGDGKTIEPTGKKYKLTMCTVGHWDRKKMKAEYLFWDNKALLDQIGLGE